MILILGKVYFTSDAVFTLTNTQVTVYFAK